MTSAAEAADGAALITEDVLSVTAVKLKADENILARVVGPSASLDHEGAIVPGGGLISAPDHHLAKPAPSKTEF